MGDLGQVSLSCQRKSGPFIQRLASVIIPHGSTQPRVVPLLSFIERIEVSTGKDVVAMAGSPPDNKQKDKLKNAQEHCFGFKALGSGGITREGYSPLGPGTRNRSCKE